jgi:hypothetical protein
MTRGRFRRNPAASALKTPQLRLFPKRQAEKSLKTRRFLASSRGGADKTIVYMRTIADFDTPG